MYVTELINEMINTLIIIKIKHLNILEVIVCFSWENGELLFVCVYFYVISIQFLVEGEKNSLKQ